MIEQIVASYQKQQKSAPALKVFGFCLSVLAVIVACYISFFSEMPIAIEKPAILVLASFLILVPFKSETPNTVQKIMVFYLVSVPVNELSARYFQISFLAANISVSYTTVVLLLCTIGYLAGRANSANTPRGVGRANILYGWVLALAVIIVHMVLLSLILSKFYGYGYERNLSVLGNLCLYFLLFIVLWEKLDRLRFRQGVGLILAFFYLAVIVAKR